MCQPFPPIVNMAGRTLSLYVGEMIIRIAKRQCHTINWTREVISITNITIFIVLREKKKKEKKEIEKNEKESERMREGKKRPMRERKHKKHNCVLYVSYTKKKKKSKRKKKNYHIPRRKRDRFIPQDSTIEMRIASTCVFHIWNFFSFFFFSFPFCLRQNEIVQNKNSFWIYAMMLLLPLSSLELSLSLYFFLHYDRACIFPFDIIVKNYIATKERENQDSWTFNAHVKNSDNYPCNGPLLHQLDYLGFERSRIYFAIYDIICQLCCCTKIFGVWFNNLELY